MPVLEGSTVAKVDFPVKNAPIFLTNIFYRADVVLDLVCGRNPNRVCRRLSFHRNLALVDLALDEVRDLEVDPSDNTVDAAGDSNEENDVGLTDTASLVYQVVNERIVAQSGQVFWLLWRGNLRFSCFHGVENLF